MNKFKLTGHQTNLVDAVWIDVNPNLSDDGSVPDRLGNEQAINLCSLFNLFNCPVGARGRIFEPQYGTNLERVLQEPIDQLTARTVSMYLIQAIQRWEPRIKIDYSATTVTPDMSIPGYRVRLSYSIISSGIQAVADYQLVAGL